jgi:hypothetical protein
MNLKLQKKKIYERCARIDHLAFLNEISTESDQFEEFKTIYEMALNILPFKKSKKNSNKAETKFGEITNEACVQLFYSIILNKMLYDQKDDIKDSPKKMFRKKTVEIHSPSPQKPDVSEKLEVGFVMIPQYTATNSFFKEELEIVDQRNGTGIIPDLVLGYGNFTRGAGSVHEKFIWYERPCIMLEFKKNFASEVKKKESLEIQVINYFIHFQNMEKCKDNNPVKDNQFMQGQNENLLCIGLDLKKAIIYYTTNVGNKNLYPSRCEIEIDIFAEDSKSLENLFKLITFIKKVLNDEVKKPQDDVHWKSLQPSPNVKKNLILDMNSAAHLSKLQAKQSLKTKNRPLMSEDEDTFPIKPNEVKKKQEEKQEDNVDSNTEKQKDKLDSEITSPDVIKKQKGE